MKKAFLVFVPALFLMVSAALRCPAQQVTLSPTATKTVSAIRLEARAAQHNATIYQWQRVNREVDRIVSEAHKISDSVPASATRDDMQKAIQDLRAARLNHSVSGVTDATKRILADCDTLLHL